jgi:hypothetical protein
VRTCNPHHICPVHMVGYSWCRASPGCTCTNRPRRCSAPHSDKCTRSRNVRRTCTRDKACIINFNLCNAGFWIQTRFGSGFNDFVDPVSESGSRIQIQGQENKIKTAHISTFFQIYNKKVCYG